MRLNLTERETLAQLIVDWLTRPGNSEKQLAEELGLHIDGDGAKGLSEKCIASLKLGRCHEVPTPTLCELLLRLDSIAAMRTAQLGHVSEKDQEGVIRAALQEMRFAARQQGTLPLDLTTNTRYSSQGSCPQGYNRDCIGCREPECYGRL